MLLDTLRPLVDWIRHNHPQASQELRIGGYLFPKAARTRRHWEPFTPGEWNALLQGIVEDLRESKARLEQPYAPRWKGKRAPLEDVAPFDPSLTPCGQHCRWDSFEYRVWWWENATEYGEQIGANISASVRAFVRRRGLIAETPDSDSASAPLRVTFPRIRATIAIKEYARTGNLGYIQVLLGHTDHRSTVTYLSQMDNPILLHRRSIHEEALFVDLTEGTKAAVSFLTRLRYRAQGGERDIGAKQRTRGPVKPLPSPSGFPATRTEERRTVCFPCLPQLSESDRHQRRSIQILLFRGLPRTSRGHDSTERGGLLSHGE